MLARFLMLVGIFVMPAAYADEALDGAEIVAAFEAYFNEMTTFEADFVQWDASANLEQRGTFALQRPKQFNWTYVEDADGEKTVTQRVVGTGSRIFYVDGLDGLGGGQVTQIPMNFGLASVLTQETLDLEGGEIQVISAIQEDEVLKVTVQPAYEDDGVNVNATVTLVMTDEPRQLVQMVTTNPLGQETVISFNNVRQGAVLAADLFDYTPPSEDVGFGN